MILAVTEDREAATAIGIDAQRVFLITFIIGASLAALGGALASPTTSLVPGMGADMIVLVVRGRGDGGARADRGHRAHGADDRADARLRRSTSQPEFEVLVPYLMMVLVLLVRPSGLFGAVQVRQI